MTHPEYAIHGGRTGERGRNPHVRRYFTYTRPDGTEGEYWVKAARVIDADTLGVLQRVMEAVARHYEQEG